MADEMEGPEGMKMGGIHYEVVADYSKFDEALESKEAEMQSGDKSKLTFEREGGEEDGEGGEGLMTANKSKSVGILKKGLGAAALPVTVALIGLKKVFEKSEAFKMLTEGMSDFMGAIGDTILIGLVLFVKYLWGKLGDFADWLFESAEGFWNWIQSGASKLWDWLSAGTANLWGWLTSSPAGLWGWLSSGMANLWGWLSNSTADLWGWITGGVQNIGMQLWDWISGGPSSMINLFFDWIKKGGDVPLWDWLKSSTADLWGWLKEGPAQFWNWLTDGASMAGKLWDWLRGGITGMGQTVFHWLTMGGSALWEWLSSGIGGAGERLLNWLTTGGSEQAGKFRSWLSGAGEKIKKAVDDTGETLSDGWDYVSGEEERVDDI